MDYWKQSARNIVEAFAIYCKGKTNESFNFEEFDEQLVKIASFNDQCALLMSPFLETMKVDWAWQQQRPMHISTLKAFFKEVQTKLKANQLQTEFHSVEDYKKALGVTEFCYDKAMQDLRDEVSLIVNDPSHPSHRTAYQLIIDDQVQEISNKELSLYTVYCRTYKIGIYINPFDVENIKYVLIQWPRD